MQEGGCDGRPDLLVSNEVARPALLGGFAEAYLHISVELDHDVEKLREGEARRKRPIDAACLTEADRDKTRA